MKHWGQIAVLVSLGVCLNGCGSGPRMNDDPPVSLADPLPGAVSQTSAEEEGVPSGETFQVKFETSKGEFVVEVHPEWAPKGAAQFRKLVESGFYNECRFFRVVPDFMVQFGINGDPQVQGKWRDAPIKDDPVTQSNKRSYVTFATAGPNTRTTQIFINFKDNSFLDSQGFAPFGRVISGMDIVDAIESKHGERPDQGQIQSQGNAYLMAKFPELDHVKKAGVVGDSKEEGASGEGASEESAPEQDAAKKAAEPTGPSE